MTRQVMSTGSGYSLRLPSTPASKATTRPWVPASLRNPLPHPQVLGALHMLFPLSKYRDPSPGPVHSLAEGKVQDLSRVAPVVSEQATSPSVPEAHNAIQAASVNHGGACLPQQLHNARLHQGVTEARWSGEESERRLLPALMEGGGVGSWGIERTKQEPGLG